MMVSSAPARPAYICGVNEGEAIVWFVCCGLPMGVVVIAVLQVVGSAVAHQRRAARVKQQFDQAAVRASGRALPFFVFGEDGRAAVGADPETGHVLIWTREAEHVHVLDGRDVILAEVEAFTTNTLLGGPHIERIDLKIDLRDKRCPYVSVCFLHAKDRKSTDQAHEKLAQARTWQARLNVLRDDPPDPLRLAGEEGS